MTPFQKAGRASALIGLISRSWLVRPQPLHPFYFMPSLCSSTAEQPVDKRQPVERHHAEGPFPKVVSVLAESDAAKAAATFFQTLDDSDR